MPESLSSDSSHDSSFDPGAYVEHTRNVLKDKKLRAGGTRTSEHAAEGSLAAGEAKKQLESEYRDVVTLLTWFNNQGLANQETDHPLIESFFEEYVRKVSAFAVVTARARDKGYLDESLYDLPEDKQNAIFAELNTDYREINAAAAGKPFYLSKDKLHKNPLLYHSAEIFAKLALEYPEIPEGTRDNIALSNPMNPEGAAARAVTIAKDIAVKYPDIPPGYRFYLATNHPDNYGAVMENIGPTVDALTNKYKDVPPSYIFNIVIRNKSPEAALIKAIEIAKHIERQFPEIPAGYRLRIPMDRSDWENYTKELIKTSDDLAVKYKGKLADSYFFRLAFDFANSHAAAEKLLKTVEQLRSQFSTLSLSSLTSIAYRNPVDPAEAARSLVTRTAELVAGFPELGAANCQDIALHYKKNPEVAAKSILTNSKKYFALHSEIGFDNWIMLFRRSAKEPETVATRFLKAVGDLEKEHPEIPTYQRQRIASRSLNNIAGAVERYKKRGEVGEDEDGWDEDIVKI